MTIHEVQLATRPSQLRRTLIQIGGTHCASALRSWAVADRAQRCLGRTSSSRCTRGSRLHRARHKLGLTQCSVVSLPTGLLAAQPRKRDLLLRRDAPSVRWWIQNWKTPAYSASASCYRATVTFADSSTLSAFFKLTK